MKEKNNITILPYHKESIGYGFSPVKKMITISYGSLSLISNGTNWLENFPENDEKLGWIPPQQLLHFENWKQFFKNVYQGKQKFNLHIYNKHEGCTRYKFLKLLFKIKKGHILLPSFPISLPQNVYSHNIIQA